MSIQIQGAATPTFTVVSEQKPSFTIRFGKWVAGNAHVVLAFMVFFALWEAAVYFLEIAPFILPPPTTIASRLVRDWWMLSVHSLTTLQAVVIGFSLSRKSRRVGNAGVMKCRTWWWPVK